MNDRPIATLSGSTFTYLHGNLLGAPQVMTNASQTVLGRLSTLPFGETRSTSGSFTVNLRMPGQYYDAETGFSHNVNRDYVPGLGRYLQFDPAGIFQTRNEGGMNPYLYVNARPMDLMDPLGLTSSMERAWDAFLNGYQMGNRYVPGFGPTLAQNLDILFQIYSFGQRGAVWAIEEAAEALISPGEATPETTRQTLQDIANRAAEAVGEGRGPVYGTKVHSEFQTQIESLESQNLRTEVSFKNQQEVNYGTPGSVRLDVVEYDANGNILNVYDLKTGGATLTPGRIQQIQSHLPGDGANIPVIQVTPQTPQR